MMWFTIIIGCLLAFLLLWGAYIEGQLSMMKDNLKACELYLESLENLEKRIRLMRDFIEYNEDIVNNARGMTAKKGMEHIEKQYVIWDDDYYEEYDDFCRDD